MIDIHDEEYVMESAEELREVFEQHPKLSKEPAEWVQRLWHYAIGRIKWNTGMDWVCEDHPHMPYGHMVFRGGKLIECGGIGIPPICPNDEAQDLEIMNQRCEESLPPELFEKWEAVKAMLIENRQALKGYSSEQPTEQVTRKDG